MSTRYVSTVILMCLFFGFGMVSAATIKIDPESTEVVIGQDVTISVIGQDFPVTEGGDFDLKFDNNILAFKEIGINTAVWDSSDPGVFDNDAGTIKNVAIGTFGNPSGEFDVAQIIFETLAVGESDLMLTASASAINPWAGGGQLIDPDFIGGTVTVSVIPLPATGWFLISGIIGLLVARKRKFS